MKQNFLALLFFLLAIVPSVAFVVAPHPVGRTECSLKSSKNDGNTLIDKIKDTATDTKDFIKNKAIDAKDAVTEKAVDAKDAVKEKAVDAKDAVKEKATNIKESIVGKDDGDDVDGAEAVGKRVDDAIDDLPDDFEEAGRRVDDSFDGDKK